MIRRTIHRVVESHIDRLKRLNLEGIVDLLTTQFSAHELSISDLEGKQLLKSKNFTKSMEIYKKTRAIELHTNA